MIHFIPILVLMMLEYLSESLNLQPMTIGNWMGGLIIISFLLFVVILLIAYVLVIGAYPLIVRDAIQGDTIDFRKALTAAAGKFFTIISAGIVVALLTLLGLTFFIIPGLIIMVLYFYWVSAIVIENRGLTDGLSASKSFAKDKKFKTFLLYILPGPIFTIIYLIFLIILTIADGYVYVWLIDLIIAVFIAVLLIVYFVWICIIPSYVYIEYAMKNENEECTIENPT